MPSLRILLRLSAVVSLCLTFLLLQTADSQSPRMGGQNAAAGGSVTSHGQTIPAPPTERQGAAVQQNPTTGITVSPSKLDFESQVVGSTSPVRTVTVLPTTGGGPAKVSATLTGDFQIVSNTCDSGVAEPCTLGVTFSPKHVGETTAGLNVVAVSGTSTFSVIVPVTGRGNCDEGKNAFTRAGFVAFIPVVVVVGLYLVGIIIVRWNLIARPTRSLLEAYIQAVKNRVAALGTGTTQVSQLLSRAEEFIREKNPLFMLPDYLYWDRGQELSAWSCVHEAEQQMAALLPPEAVRAELERAELDLREISSQVAKGLADEIHVALATTEPPAGRLQAVLGGALGFLHDRTDTKFASLISWHNKTIWLLGAGLLFILALSATLGHEILFLVGATGGLLSRLSRSLHREEVPTDYGASWTTLFLSPVVGALAGWSGVLLLIVASDLNVLGSALRIEWCNPYSPVALGAALLLGTSERLFDTILNQLEQKLNAQPTSSGDRRSTDPRITSPASLPVAKVGQSYSYQLTVSGGTGPYKWALIGGALPTGLALDPSGQVVGTPTAPGEADVTVHVIDATGKTSSQQFKVVAGQGV